MNMGLTILIKLSKLDFGIYKLYWLIIPVLGIKVLILYFFYNKRAKILRSLSVKLLLLNFNLLFLYKQPSSRIQKAKAKGNK